MNNTPESLTRVAALAEHLDTLGDDGRQAAIVVRDVLSILRGGQFAYHGPIVQFAADLLHDHTVHLDQVRERVSQRITAKQCWDTAREGGAAVAELVDSALVMAVRMIVPQVHTGRAWPTVGESVMTIAALAEVPNMSLTEIEQNTGQVQQVDTRRRRVHVQWPTHKRWINVADIAAFRSWRTAEDDAR